MAEEKRVFPATTSDTNITVPRLPCSSSWQGDIYLGPTQGEHLVPSNDSVQLGP